MKWFWGFVAGVWFAGALTTASVEGRMTDPHPGEQVAASDVLLAALWPLTVAYGLSMLASHK
jgi:hypothetical protein